MARPSSFTAELAAAILARIADGQSLREICRDEGMPDKATVLRWVKESGEFRDQYAHAREAQADHFADEILEIADDASNDFMLRKRGDEATTVPNHEHIQRARLRVDARKWLMAKMAPRKYGDRTIVAGDPEAPLLPEPNLRETAKAILAVLGRAATGAGEGDDDGGAASEGGGGAG